MRGVKCTATSTAGTFSHPVTGDDFRRSGVLFRVADLLAVIVVHKTVHELLRVLMIVVITKQLHRTFIKFAKSVSEEIVTALGEVVDMSVEDALRLVKLLLLGHTSWRALDQVTVT